jgi:hypothetical protein
MNIFVLDLDHRKCAQEHVDKHVVKMILEYSQILSTVRRKFGQPAPYKSTHINHPCTKWAGQSAENYEWLHGLLGELLAEYTHRYQKVHASQKHFDSLALDFHIPRLGLTNFAQAMPDACKHKSPVVAYRTYYKTEKTHIASWKGRQVPEWWDE